MNRLIEKLNKQGFDVTDDLQFNNITLARRRESFNWYVYVSKLMNEGIPLVSTILIASLDERAISHLGTGTPATYSVLLAGKSLSSSRNSLYVISLLM